MGRAGFAWKEIDLAGPGYPGASKTTQLFASYPTVNTRTLDGRLPEARLLRAAGGYDGSTSAWWQRDLVTTILARRFGKVIAAR